MNNQVSASEDQLAVACLFLESIINEDIESFWQLISLQSQDYIMSLVDSRKFVTIEEAVKIAISKLREVLFNEGYLPDYAICSNAIVETEEKMSLKILSNVRTKIHIIAEMDVLCRTLPIIRETRNGSDCWTINYLELLNLEDSYELLQ